MARLSGNIHLSLIDGTELSGCVVKRRRSYLVLENVLFHQDGGGRVEGVSPLEVEMSKVLMTQSSHETPPKSG